MAQRGDDEAVGRNPHCLGGGAELIDLLLRQLIGDIERMQ